jgi:hypothetical protein
MKKEADMNTKMVQENDGSCVGIHELIDWQIIQYRRAVDAHRHDLSKVEGRCVSWQEAEMDFNSRDRAVMGEKWRVEYCGAVCPQRSKCLIALHFLHSKKTEPLYRVG